ncbi:aminomethyltransferase, mitochondrial [Dorcoceras hygrometricum]|uniref:Aminomethyltransferase, mitochondrial n=1 Tax=Dorcoceras hygrometricum TaxID=472368 RepID=A0A2Z7C5T3_9LAMI|nr:aminomethyltransferase, mitochondrial [Dorcoceras hygrometricum]
MDLARSKEEEELLQSTRTGNAEKRQSEEERMGEAQVQDRTIYPSPIHLGWNKDVSGPANTSTQAQQSTRKTKVIIRGKGRIGGSLGAALKMRNLLEEFYGDHGFRPPTILANPLKVGKGKDVGLNQIALFEGKVAGDNGEQVLCRDIYRSYGLRLNRASFWKKNNLLNSELEAQNSELRRAYDGEQEQENAMLQILMRVEQAQKVTEDARRFAEQDAAAQRYASQVFEDMPLKCCPEICLTGSVLRVWDVLLFLENRVMLFRTALSLMELHGPALVTTKEAGDAVTVVTGTVPVDHCVLDFATVPTDSLLGLITMNDQDEMYSSARVYEIGRRKPTEEDSDPDDAESEEDHDDEGDDDSILGQDLDGDSTTCMAVIKVNEMVVSAASLVDCQVVECGNLIWDKLTGHTAWPVIVPDEYQGGARKGLNKTSEENSVLVQLFGTYDFARVTKKQGPLAAPVLQHLTKEDLSKVYFSDFKVIDINGSTCYLTRTGYTGEDGFEISVPSEHAIDLAKAILDKSENKVRLTGLGARDSLRLEAGLCLYGYDMEQHISPVEAGLTWAIGKRRRAEGGFLGAEVILKQIEEGPSIRRVGFISFPKGLLSPCYLKCKRPVFASALEKAKIYLSEPKLPKEMLQLRDGGSASLVGGSASFPKSDDKNSGSFLDSNLGDKVVSKSGVLLWAKLLMTQTNGLGPS